MTDWVFAQTETTEELAKLHFFAVKKKQANGVFEFRITVHEFAERNKLNMRFLAQADKQTNQKTAPFTPTGWGETLLDALSECVKAIRRFPYEGEVDTAR